MTREQAIQALVAAARELADLMDDVRNGEYTPDALTTQPVRAALRAYDAAEALQEAWRDEARARVAVLEEALRGLLDIVADSRGVAGYHLNGNVADWGEFSAVGEARAALAGSPSVLDAVRDEARERIAVLEALDAVSRLTPEERDLFVWHPHSAIGAMRLIRANERIAVLEAALREYAHHKFGCRAARLPAQSGPCDCGRDAALFGSPSALDAVKQEARAEALREAADLVNAEAAKSDEIAESHLDSAQRSHFARLAAHERLTALRILNLAAKEGA